MFGTIPTCHNCVKEIKKDVDAFVIIRYPKRKGITEITAYLKMKVQFIVLRVLTIKNHYVNVRCNGFI